MGIHPVVSLIEPKGEIGETWQPTCISGEFSYVFLWSGLLVRVWVVPDVGRNAWTLLSEKPLATSQPWRKNLGGVGSFGCGWFPLKD